MKNDTTGEIKGKPNKSFWIVLFTVFAALAISIAAGTLFGSADLSFSTVWQVIKFKLFGLKDSNVDISSVYVIMWELRMPRAILAIAVGGGLAVSGCAIQAVTKNVLADPYIIGVSSGALAMVSLLYLLGGGFLYSQFGIQLFAFAGAVIALVFVYSIGTAGGTSSNNRLVLVGVAVSVVLNAVSMFFITMAPTASAVRSIMSWTMGSLAGARWDNVGIPFWGTIIGSLFFLFTARAYNLISMGDETAVSLGINVRRIKKTAIIFVALITGISVAVGGIIGLVGFIIPHIVRFLTGAEHRRLFPLAFLTGGLFLLWMDILSRTVLAPREMPIGVFTALLGGPFFVWLLYRQSKSGRR